MDPNFPLNLEISPSLEHTDMSAAFNADAQTNAIQKFGIAGRVWEAAYVLLHYLRGVSHSVASCGPEFNPRPLSEMSDDTPITALELGAGTGVVGLTLAELLVEHGRTNDCIILTDLPQVCELLRENLRLHMPLSNSRTVSVEPLAWGSAEHAERISQKLDGRQLTHIICSDLVYFPELLAPLLRSLLHLTASASPPKIVMSYKTRSLSKETPFWSAFGLWFTYEPVLIRSNSNTEWKRLGVEQDAFVFCAARRTESRMWVVPEDDDALLDGEGAKGSLDRKSDDTFEILLLMGLDGD